MADGLADKMIRVDMTTQTATVESFPAKWRLLGGRALSARILVEECDPKCEPLGPGNVLVIAPGVCPAPRLRLPAASRSAARVR